jgi:biopolymer transport protein ExbB
MADAKKTAAKVASSANPKKNSGHFWLNVGIIAVCMTITHVLFYFVFGADGNFRDAAHHEPANMLGTIRQGGWVVPILMGTLLVCIAFVVERGLTIFRSKGKMGNAEFIRKIQHHLANKNVQAAISECDKQSGSVGNVMKAGLLKYGEMTTNTELDTDQKVAAIKKEIEETTSLELPILEKNLVFLSTISSAATLLGLFGTVLGMLRAFSAMAQAGAPDANALAAGISEALVNTALGIGTSFIAVIAYNFYTTIIDNITYGIDESGFTLEQTFLANYK